MEANSLPSLTSVKASVTSATEGAAAKSPAKPLGLSTSLSVAKSEIMAPPAKNRMTHCIVAPDGNRRDLKLRQLWFSRSPLYQGVSLAGSNGTGDVAAPPGGRDCV